MWFPALAGLGMILDLWNFKLSSEDDFKGYTRYPKVGIKFDELQYGI